MAYQCKIDIFEGPLDLLLHLLKEQKMDIQDISIAEITRQYMDALDFMHDLNLEIAGEYLVMAAELTRIKSKCLLPVEEREDEENEEGQDPRADLMRRLQEYQRYKDAAFQLRMREHDRQRIFARNAPLDNGEGKDALVEASAFDLLNAFQKVLRSKEFKKDYELTITTFSVADRIPRILEILNATESVTFESMFTALNSREEVIVTFLALLELMRLKLLRVQQVNQFDPIRIYRSADRETQDEVLQRRHASSGEESSSHG